MERDIDLTRAELGELVAGLGAGRSDRPFGTYAVRSDDPGAELGRHVERTVFRETFGDTPGVLSAEYGWYEQASVFFVVVDHRRGVPAGTVRLIVPSTAGFKTLDDVARVWGEPVDDVLARVDGAWDLSRLWDISTLAVAPEYRGEAALGLVTQALVQALAMVGRLGRVQRYVAILDVPVLRMLQWRMARPFEAFPGLDTRPYLGSPASSAVWGDAATWDRRLAGADPVLHDVMCGRGLEPVLATPDWFEVTDLLRDVTRRTSVGHG